MFCNATADYRPLTSISASPLESVTRPEVGNHSSFDSIINDKQRSQKDSLFKKTHYHSSMSSDSVFGDDYHFQKGHLLPPNQLFQPLSVHSISSIHSLAKEDDTMISVSSFLILFASYKVINDIYILQMLGGHVCHQSISSLVEASPCICVEKQKHSAAQGISIYPDLYDLPNKARIVENPSIDSTSSYQFGGDQMIKAQQGVLEWQSLEDSCLSADGEEMVSACEFLFPHFQQ